VHSRRFAIVCTLIVLGVVCAISLGDMLQATTAEPALAPFEFHRTGATTPQIAASVHFRACATRSPQHFVQHLLLGVCDGPIATLNKFAECLHSTEFVSGEESYTVYDLPKGIKKETVRVVASGDFDNNDKKVKALQIEAVSTYYAEKFIFIDVAADDLDGRTYQTRIVVGAISGRWYAIPRCRSATSFYRIADAM
jgi:hypothetical protein